ncbi:FUSC family protein [Streptomyces paromomycinus]|uniref:FUSC family protein n=1 Tax=Streptomyces paromomycinus TaxID=92743 RepID=A0A401WDE9_STREY|nr:aromatic acid exporter family protein [Streptomyces paromomycinus]GCD47300.1 FUSC family protein [Streptomyces paromomycinus]
MREENAAPPGRRTGTAQAVVGLARIRDGPWAVRWLVAVRAAVAAALAWQLCRSMWEAPQPGPAVVAALLVVHPTVFRSCTAGLQYAAGCTLGALIALPAAVLVGPTWLSMTAVLLLSLLAAGHERLGAHGLHVPITAVFVLLLGPSHAGQILPHLLEIGVGIAVAVLFNALLPPPLRLRAAESALDRLRDELAGVLDGTATAVREARHPDDVLGTQWPARVADTTARARSALGQAHESLRWNVRARNRNAVWHLDRKVLESLERVAHDAEACVGALDALAAQRPAGAVTGPGAPEAGSAVAAWADVWDREFRAGCARLLTCLALCVRGCRGGSPHPVLPATRRVWRELAERCGDRHDSLDVRVAEYRLLMLLDRALHDVAGGRRTVRPAPAITGPAITTREEAHAQAAAEHR